MSSQLTDDPLRIFLSYAREDYNAVLALYDRLKAQGLKPWMDKRDILPGQQWEVELRKAIRESHFFIACLSEKSVEKRGYLRREFRQALDLWQEKLQDDIYLIPVRLEACEVAGELREFQWVDLYEEDGWDMLLRAIQFGAEKLGRPVPVRPEPSPERPRRVETPPVERGVPALGPRSLRRQAGRLRRVVRPPGVSDGAVEAPLIAPQPHRG